MTVRELKEKLNTMPDNYIVLINVERAGYPYTKATYVSKGFNELDGCVIIDDYVEDNDCTGCVYEDADGSTAAISNCVCCSRNVDYAKSDYYRKR